MEEKQGFYAIITSDVLFDPNLTEFQKLLFAYMSLLTVKEGYSWATNKHYAEKFEKDEKTISRAIRELEDCGYLVSIIDAKAGNRRQIYLNTNPDSFGDRTKKSLPIDKNVQRGSDKNVTNNSNIDKNKKECTGGSEISIFSESSENENQAPQVKAQILEEEQEPHIKENNICSGLKETEYKQALITLLKKFEREY